MVDCFLLLEMLTFFAFWDAIHPWFSSYLLVHLCGLFFLCYFHKSSIPQDFVLASYLFWISTNGSRLFFSTQTLDRVHHRSPWQLSPVVSDCSRYDRNKLSLKEIMNVQYVSCMNPTAGSFTINPRLQVREELWCWGPKHYLTWGWCHMIMNNNWPFLCPAFLKMFLMEFIYI